MRDLFAVVNLVQTMPRSKMQARECSEHSIINLWLTKTYWKLSNNYGIGFNVLSG